MRNDKLLVVIAILVAALLVAIGVVYFAEPADSLPSFFPGSSSVELDHHHIKHGLAAVLLGVACLAFAWFRSGPRSNKKTPGGREAAHS
jgi:phosphate/sulfate permease